MQDEARALSAETEPECPDCRENLLECTCCPGEG
jgi:hypothetical protein